MVSFEGMPITDGNGALSPRRHSRQHRRPVRGDAVYLMMIQRVAALALKNERAPDGAANRGSESRVQATLRRRIRASPAKPTPNVASETGSGTGSDPGV